MSFLFPNNNKDNTKQHFSADNPHNIMSSGGGTDSNANNNNSNSNNSSSNSGNMKTFWDAAIWKEETNNRKAAAKKSSLTKETTVHNNNNLIGALDQGTSSTRFVVVTRRGQLLCWAQLEHAQIYPQQGWHEHNPLALIMNSLACIRAVQELFQRNLGGSGSSSSTAAAKLRLAALGITNQRETTLAWNRETGVPYYNAIVWDDARTAATAHTIANGNLDRLRATTGLPLSSYFCGTKVRWLLDNVPALRADLQSQPGQVCFGTVDTWLVYQLTGTPSTFPGALHCQGRFVTDVTNASRWLFLNLHTQTWQPELVHALCAPHTVPLSTLPAVGPSSSRHFYGTCSDALRIPLLQGVPIGAVLGDQQAALFGQTAFGMGQAKNTYGTGLFLMMNTGDKPIPSTHGLLTTIAYQLQDEPVQYALEGSVAHAGSTIQWLRDQLQIIHAAPDTEDLATQTNEGLYFVPAFGGLFCPHWRADARACLVGLTTGHHKGHVCRAALEAAAYQTREVLEAMQADAGITLDSLKVDGGASANRLLMQFQADMLNVPVIQPVVLETTSLGAAFAAGLCVGVWSSTAELAELWAVKHVFAPQMGSPTRQLYFGEWKKAVSKSLGWVEEEIPVEDNADKSTRSVSKSNNVVSRETALALAVGAMLIGFLAGRRRSSSS